MNKACLAASLIVLIGASSFQFAREAQSAPISFSGTFSGANEFPTVPTAGIGTALVDLDVVAHTLRVRATFSDLTGTVTVAHIHAPAAPGSNASVATQTPSFAGFPAGVTAGSYDHTFDTLDAATYNAPFLTASGGTAAGAEAALLAHLQAGLAYFNIHTSFRAAGEIRANLTAVPEPASLGLLACALIGIAAVTRRRR